MTPTVEMCGAPGFASLPVSAAGSLLVLLGFAWAVRRSLRGGTPVVMLVLLVAVIPLQRIGFQVADSQLPLALAIAPPMVFAAMLGGQLRIDPIRTAAVAVTLAAVAVVTAIGPSHRVSMLSLAMLATIYLPYMLAWPCRPGAFHSVLHCFQDLMLVGAVFGIVQFAGQFPLGVPAVFPLDSLLPKGVLLQNFCQFRELQGDVVKASGMVFLEPSIFSQALAWALLIEVLYMGRRAWRLLAYGGALALSFGGTGLALAAIALPFALLARRHWDLLAVGGLAAAAVVVGLLLVDFRFDVAMRLGELTDPYSSGFARFVAPVRMVDAYLLTGDAHLWHGYGAGAVTRLVASMPYDASDPTWVKAFLEYGIIAGTALLVTVCVFGLGIPPRGAAVLGCAAILQYLLMNGYLLTFTFHILAWVVLVWPRPATESTDAQHAQFSAGFAD